MNFMKPKSTVHNEPALLYKRYIGLEKSTSLSVVYETINSHQVHEYWVFSKDERAFVQVDSKADYKDVIMVGVGNVFLYIDTKYEFVNDMWQETLKADSTLLSVKFNDVGKYQTHKYYFVASFDWMLKGGVEGVASQPIKGAIMPLDAMNIVHYNDDICIQKDDLIVIDNKLFAVEDTEVTQKRMPKPYNVYSATLNSIL